MNDCRFFSEKTNKCLALKELYCKNEKCVFYRNKNKSEAKEQVRITKKELFFLPIGTRIITDRCEFIKTNSNNCFRSLNYAIPDLFVGNITKDLKITDSAAGKEIIKIEKPNFETFWERNEESRNIIDSNYEHIPRID